MFIRCSLSSQVLKFIARERASFVATAADINSSNMTYWLPVQVSMACQAYNNWRQHVGAIVWPQVDVQVLIDLVLRGAPNMQDPILRGPRLGSFRKAATNQAPSQHVEKNEGRPSTRGARKASIAAPAAARQRIRRQQWLGGAAAERQLRKRKVCGS